MGTSSAHGDGALSRKLLRLVIPPKDVIRDGQIQGGADSLYDLTQTILADPAEPAVKFADNPSLEARLVSFYVDAAFDVWLQFFQHQDRVALTQQGAHIGGGERVGRRHY